MAEFYFEINYIKGSSNRVADWLSRYSYQGGKQQEESNILEPGVEIRALWKEFSDQ